jgi:hypothetical protein
MQYSENDQKISGIIPQVPGVMYGQNERVDELNNRIYQRVCPDNFLQPNLDLRPASTKYSLFPIVDLRKQPTIDLAPALDYSIESGFVPPASRGPTIGYTDNIQIESQLRNQFFALQKGADQGVYVPSSNSDLYRISIPQSSNHQVQPYPELFSQPIFQNNRTVVNGVGGDLLFNNTRTQLRGLGR